MNLTRRKSLIINLVLMMTSLLVCLGGLEAVAWAWERRQAQGPYAWELVASRRIQLDSPWQGWSSSAGLSTSTSSTN